MSKLHTIWTMYLFANVIEAQITIFNDVNKTVVGFGRRANPSRFVNGFDIFFAVD